MSESVAFPYFILFTQARVNLTAIHVYRCNEATDIVVLYIIKNNNNNNNNNNKKRCHYYTYGLTTTPDQTSNDTVWKYLYLYITTMNNDQWTIKTMNWFNQDDSAKQDRDAVRINCGTTSHEYMETEIKSCVRESQ